MVDRNTEIVGSVLGEAKRRAKVAVAGPGVDLWLRVFRTSPDFFMVLYWENGPQKTVGYSLYMRTWYLKKVFLHVGEWE